jgi:two-component system, NarL family, response regulator NreC
MPNLHLVGRNVETPESSRGSRIRVVLAVDHALMRSSLRVLLDGEEDIEVVAVADDLESARRHVRDGRPDVFLLDLVLVGGPARDAIGKLRSRAPRTQLVLLTLDESVVVAQHVLACGALGLVLKDQADVELAPAVRAAARGERYVSPRVADRLAAALRGSLVDE